MEGKTPFYPPLSNFSNLFFILFLIYLPLVNWKSSIHFHPLFMFEASVCSSCPLAPPKLEPTDCQRYFWPLPAFSDIPIRQRPHLLLDLNHALSSQSAAHSPFAALCHSLQLFFFLTLFCYSGPTSLFFSLCMLLIRNMPFLVFVFQHIVFLKLYWFCASLFS